MMQIQLTKGKTAQVSDADYETLSRYKWYAQWAGNGWYAARSTPMIKGESTHVLMHREVLGAVTGQEIDHIDGNGLNNQRENLRFCTRSQNHQNRHRKRGGYSSQYIGVHWSNADRKWIAKIQVNGKRIHLGMFDSEIDAAIARSRAKEQYFGEFACADAIIVHGDVGENT